MKTEDGKVVRSKYCVGDQLITKKGDLLIIYEVNERDKFNRARYMVMNLTQLKIYQSLTCQQISEMINDIDDERIERNKRFRCYGRIFTFKDLDELFKLKRGSTLRFYKRNGRDDRKIIERIGKYLFNFNYE